MRMMIGLLIVVLAPTVQAAFVAPFSSSVSPSIAKPLAPQLAYRQSYDTEEEAKTAFRAAQSAAQAALSNKKQESIKSLPDMSDLQKEALAATAGGALLGAGLGMAAAMGQPDYVSAVDPMVPAVMLGSAAYAMSSQSDEKGKAARFLLGKPTQALGRLIANKFKVMVEGAKASILSFPDKVAEVFSRQVERTKASIMAIPGNMMQFIKYKIDEAVEESKRLPQKASNAAVGAAQDLVLEIQATPGRMAESAKHAMEQAVEDTKLKFNAMTELEVKDTKIVGEQQELVPRPPMSEPPVSLFMY